MTNNPGEYGVQGWTANLFAAVREGDLGQAIKAIASGADLNARDHQGHTPLHIATEHGHTQIARLLREYGAVGGVREGYGEKTALEIALESQEEAGLLHRAVRHGHLEFAAFLLNNNAPANQFNEHGRTPLHYAALLGQLDMLELLLKHRANPQLADKYGYTPLHYAAEQGHVPIVGRLLKRKRAALKLRDEHKRTLLHYTARRGDVSLFDLLLKYKANPHAADIYGRTPLHYAAEQGHLPIVARLLAREANPNAETADGFTPLHYAARRGHLEIARLLVEAGAGVNAEVGQRSQQGLRPVDYVDAEKYPDLHKLLLEAGAKTRDKLPAKPIPAPYEKDMQPCPICAEYALGISDMTVHHGNIYTPAADTDVSFDYSCRNCNTDFWAHGTLPSCRFLSEKVSRQSFHYEHGRWHRM